MSYIKEFEADLVKKFESGEDWAALAKWVSDKVLESYKNGVAAGRKRKSASGSSAPIRAWPAGTPIALSGSSRSRSPRAVV
ncbi:MAG TPA: hypothetical protein VN578_21185 [Candidatus Binatia bacterium]|jgi:hypothetical protein|nr:hypothetical protein [Candidatus Binatia bacterium]